MKQLFSRLLILASVSLSAGVMAANESSASLVSVEQAKQEQVNPSMWLPGNVISRRNAPISAEQTGRLISIVDVGAAVQQGQVIATLDNRHLKLQLARQQARVKQYQADVEYLTKQQRRLAALKQTNSTSVSELDLVIKDLAVAKNEVLAMQLQVKETELDIEKSQVKAPFSGQISERFAHEGELISVGRSLVQLIDTKHLDIQVAAPLSISRFMQSNSNVLVKWQDKLIELPIRTWSKAGDMSSRTFDVRLQADGLNLPAGTPVTVSLPKQKPQQATLVPRDALMLREKETFVLTVDADNKVQKINVLVGQGVGRWISVLGQLKDGDTVVTRGGERLRNGQVVRFAEKLVAKLN